MFLFKNKAKSIPKIGAIKYSHRISIFPETNAGIIEVIKPSKGLSSGAKTATTPVGSITEKLKWEEATGLTELEICWILSAQPEK